MDRYDFFGIPRRPSFTEAKEIVQRKGIKSGTELRERRKTDPELQPIPGHPDQAYKHEGWTNRYDFFGTEP